MNAPHDESEHDATRINSSAEDLISQSDVSTDAPVIGEAEDKTAISQAPPATGPILSDRLPPRALGELLIGRHLDDLLLQEYVGGGGMGAVFRAFDTRLQRTVAVKVLSSHQGDNGETARRFHVEAQSTARLDHPHIARVHNVGEDHGLPYIVLEYIEGSNLRDLILKQGPLSLADALRFTLQIADALAHAAGRAVVHRDIKPSNILITPDGQAKLVDMGLARLHHTDPSHAELTNTGTTLGTFDYISPEQARDPRLADSRSDIYSLGCTLFYMLTGRPPFTGSNPVQKLLQHQTDAPDDIRKLRPEAPASLFRSLDRMLAKKLEDRFQTPDELASAIVFSMEELGIPASQSNFPAVNPWQIRRPHWIRRHAYWLLPLLLIPFAALWMDWMLRPTSPPTEFPDLRQHSPEITPLTPTSGEPPT